MKKRVWVLFMALTLLPLAWADEDTLKTGVVWTEEKAREESMKNLEQKIDVHLFSPKDPQLSDKSGAVRDNLRLGTRQITNFEDGYYAVVYDGESTVNYYRPDGSLFKVSVCSSRFGSEPVYPRKCVEYAYPEGRFMTVSLDVSSRESFVFMPDGTLKSHWHGEKGFDTAGSNRWLRW